MKKMRLFCFIGLFLIGGSFLSCSDKKDPGAKKGAIEKMTDQTAKDVVDHLRDPINKARSAAKQEEDRMKEINSKE